MTLPQANVQTPVGVSEMASCCSRQLDIFGTGHWKLC